MISYEQAFFAVYGTITTLDIEALRYAVAVVPYCIKKQHM
jgi:hypothetical protein